MKNSTYKKELSQKTFGITDGEALAKVSDFNLKELVTKIDFLTNTNVYQSQLLEYARELLGLTEEEFLETYYHDKTFKTGE
ncbi:TPA: hypothetical protein U0910_002100 [Streptococcus suis 8830]|uniref:hypothetical protein n=1 Tax=Streptococcus suis TaxID=1307 RepID=UPI00041FE65F|nr:hypothetical protein [Streptococcus suis]HEM3204027.1 hypothetical protein [Streptococcus suis 8830]